MLVLVLVLVFVLCSVLWLPSILLSSRSNPVEIRIESDFADAAVVPMPVSSHSFPFPLSTRLDSTLLAYSFCHSLIHSLLYSILQLFLVLVLM